MNPARILLALLAFATTTASADATLARGKYLVEIGGCNDCHTDGYAQANGEVPEAQWLTGSAVGFAGPWGVSYATNLRLTVERLSEDQWLARANGGGLPPMPWPALKAMTPADKLAVYAFLKSLGPAGQEAPAPVPPGATSQTPYIQFTPVLPKL